MRGRRTVLLGCLLLALLAGCATPSLSYSDYQAKAATTAAAVMSSINTAVLGAQAWDRKQVTGAYADTVVSHAEQDAGSVINTFDSRQPPDERSIALKAKIDPPLQAASSALTDLRIAVRRGDRPKVHQALAALARPLLELGKLEELPS